MSKINLLPFDFGEGEEVSKSKAAEVWNRRAGERNE